jgi:flavodoxin I
MDIGLIYGSSTGCTRAAARRIRAELGPECVRSCHDVRACGQSAFAARDLLIIGASTWSVGELQQDWDRVVPHLEGLELEGKRIALFGLGDQRNYPETFVDGMGLLYDKLDALGACLDLGAWATDGYSFQSSRAVRDGRFVGLALDDENQSKLTASRIRKWCGQLRRQLGLPEGVIRAA